MATAMAQLKVIVDDASGYAAHYARLAEENLPDPTILGSVLCTTAVKKKWKYASIRRTEHGVFVLWQCEVDSAGLGNPRKMMQALLKLAELSKEVKVSMLDAAGIVDMELHFEAHKADAPASLWDSASGSSGDVVTKAFALDGVPRVVSDFSRAIASRLVDDSNKQNAGARKSDLGTYTGSGNLALDDAAPGAGSLALGDAFVDPPAWALNPRPPLVDASGNLALGDAAPFSGNRALVVAPTDEFRMQQLVTMHAGDTRDPLDPAMSDARRALAQQVAPKRRDNDGVFREGHEGERSHEVRVACVERHLLDLTLDKQSARERAELAAEKETLRVLWAYSSPDWDGVLRMKRPVRMKEDAWKSGLQRHVEAAVESGEAPTSKDVAGLARKLMGEGLLSRVNDTAPKGRKKAELQNRSNKVYRHVMLGRDDSETDDEANENPLATELNRKGRCGMCKYMDPAIGASILFGADAETELVDADARAAADEAKTQIAKLEKALQERPNARERRRLHEQIRGLTTSADDDADAAKTRIAALGTERDKAMNDIVRSEPLNSEEHVQKLANILQADYEQKIEYIRDDARAAAALLTNKIAALKEQLEDVVDDEGDAQLRQQIEDLTPVALGPFRANMEELKHRGLVPYVGDYPAVELARYSTPICKHALFCSEACLIKWRVAKMCPRCGDTSRLSRKEVESCEALPCAELDAAIATIHALEKKRRAAVDTREQKYLSEKVRAAQQELKTMPANTKRAWQCKRCSTRTNTVLVGSRDPTVWLPDESFEIPHLLSIRSFP